MPSVWSGKIAAIIVAFLVVGIGAGYVLGATTAARVQEKPVEVEKVVEVLPKPLFTARTIIFPGLALEIAVAIANNYFAEERIELQYLIGTGRDMTAAMIKGEADFVTPVTQFHLVNLAARQPWRQVVALRDQEIYALLVSQRLSDQVRSVADLKGRTIGISTFGAGSWVWLLNFLKKAGLGEKDVQIVELGGDPLVILTAIKTGKVDATMFWEPGITLAVGERAAYPLINLLQPEDHRRWVGEKAVGTALSTTEAVIREKPELVQRLTNVFKKALLYIRTHTAEQIAQLLLENQRAAPFVKGFERDTLVKVIANLKPGTSDGALSKSGYENDMRPVLEVGVLKAPVPFEQAVDIRFAGMSP